MHSGAMYGSFPAASRQHPFLSPELRPRAFAHRGWHIGELAGMENSLSAFRRAVREGFHYLETDVHATSDGVAVVHHDPDLRRTTDSTGEIRRRRWSSVSDARVGGREPVCSLDQLLEELPGALLNIDVKADSAVVATLRTIRRHNAWHRVCLAGFSDRRLGVLRAHGDARLLTSMGPMEIGGLWLGSRASALAGAVGRASLPVGVAAQVPRRHRGVHVVDRRFVERAHARSTEVHVWTVDDPGEMAELLDVGVDGVLTDRPDLLRDVLRGREQWHTAR